MERQSKFQNRRLTLAVLKLHVTVASLRKVKIVGKLPRNIMLEVGRAWDPVRKWHSKSNPGQSIADLIGKDKLFGANARFSEIFVVKGTC